MGQFFYTFWTSGELQRPGMRELKKVGRFEEKASYGRFERQKNVLRVFFDLTF